MSQEENLTLKTELAGLFHYIQRVRTEIAAINSPADEDNNFENMSDQLDAIVEATEQATDTIMSTVEANEILLGEVRASIDDADLQAKIDQISASNMGLFEACSFQDITKVVRSLTYVEERVNKLIEAWGRSELEEITIALEKNKTEDEKLLHGPQREGVAISQDDIDALFD